MYIRPRKLIDYLEIIWKRKGALFLVMLVMLIATNIVILRMPKVYQSNATVMIATVSVPEELTGGPTYESVVNQLKNRNSLTGFVSKYRLYPSMKKVDDAIAQLDRSVSVEQVNRTYGEEKPSLLKVAFKHTEPEICEKLVSDLVSRFDDANRTMSRMAVAEATRMTDEMGKIQNQLKIVAPRTDIAMLESGVRTQMNTQSQISASERRGTMSQVEELRNKEYRLTTHIADLRKMINEQDAVVRAQEASVEYNNPAAATLLLKRAELNAQLFQFRGQYTDKNPKVIAVKSQLDQINKELENLRSAPKSAGGTVSVASIDLRTMRQELRNSQTDLDVTKMDIIRKERMLMGMPAFAGISLGIDPQVLASLSPENKAEYERLIAELNILTPKRDVLFKLGDLGRSGSPMFTVLERPVKPEVPIGPNRLYLLTAALMISLVVALILIFAMEIPKLVLLNNERDIEYFLGTPVLAYIPESVTPLEKTRFRRLSWARGLLFLLITPGLIFILIELFTRFGIFSMIAR